MAFIAAADYGPRERWQHTGRALELTEQAGVLAARATEENMLDRLLLRRVIDWRGREAGLRLKVDYQAAHLENRIIASYNAARGMNAGGYQSYERSEAEEAAYGRWRRALLAVTIYERHAVLDVCCHERDIVAPALPALRRGLARLGDWYRLS
ncbi:MAG: DUF6456 domain-containing protein [Alphaproteobacteria bacterium]